MPCNWSSYSRAWKRNTCYNITKVTNYTFKYRENVLRVSPSHSATRIVPVSRYRFTKFIPCTSDLLQLRRTHRTIGATKGYCIAAAIIAHLAIMQISRALRDIAMHARRASAFPRVKIHFRHGRIAGLTARGPERPRGKSRAGTKKERSRRRSRACFAFLPFTRDRPRSIRSGRIRTFDRSIYSRALVVDPRGFRSSTREGSRIHKQQRSRDARRCRNRNGI